MIAKNIPAHLMEFETLRHDEAIVYGKKIIIDTCKINDYFETMVLYPNGESIDKQRTYNRVAAMEAHERLHKKYTKEDGLLENIQLSGKYAALQETFIEAREAAAACANVEDGGASNFDCLLLYLKIFDDRRVVFAAKKAGLSMTKKTYHRKCIWFIEPPFGGQGAKRTAQAKAMYQVMKDRGYMVDMYYEID